MAGVGVTHISHIKTGNTISSTSILVDMINALDLSDDELFCDYIVKCHRIFHNHIADGLEDCSEEKSVLYPIWRNDLKQASVPEFLRLFKRNDLIFIKIMVY